MKLLDRKTVIVTGAGASHEYGFPLGSELKQHIKGTLAHKPFRALLNEQKHDNNLIDEFSELLQYSTAHDTIDSLLEHHPRFRDMGCLAIAYDLLPKGQHSAVFPAKGWYKRLFAELRLNEKHQLASNLTFVTLNYEQSLQYFLENAYRYDCSQADYEVAKDNIRQLSFIYAHGTLGLFPKAKIDDKKRAEAAVTAAQGMNIISDEVESFEPMGAAAQKIAEADNVVFLGFGYEPRTIQRLMSKAAKKTQLVLGTALGLHDDRQNEVRKRFDNRIVLFACKIEDWFNEMSFIDSMFSSIIDPSLELKRHEGSKLKISSSVQNHEMLLDAPSMRLILAGQFRKLIERYGGNQQDRILLLNTSYYELLKAACDILE